MRTYLYIFILTIFMCTAINAKPVIERNGQSTIDKHLEKNKKITTKLNPGESDEYQVYLGENTYFHLNVNCMGIDLEIELISPKGEILNRINKNSINQIEQLDDVVEEVGTYNIKILSVDKTAPAGEYTIELTDIEAVQLNQIYSQRVLARKVFMVAESIAETEGGSEKANAELYRKAIDKYTEAINLYKNVGDINRVCEILSKISNIYLNYLYKSPDSYEKALSNYFTSLELSKQTRDNYGQALALHNIGYVLGLQKKYEESINYYNKCILICRNILRDPYEEALSTYNIAALLTEQNKPQEAINDYMKASELAENAKFFNFSGLAHHQIAKIYEQNNNRKKALEIYNKQINYYKLSENKKLLANSFSDRAECYKSLYNEEDTLDNYQESLKLYREMGDKKSEAIILNNIGSLYDEYGEVYKALDYYQTALLIAKTFNDNNLISSLLNNIGIVYSSIRDYEKAVSALEESLTLSQKDDFKAIRLSNLGSTYSSFGDFNTSLVCYEEALGLSRKLKDDRSEAIIINNIAIDQLNSGNIDKAKENFTVALEKFRITKNKKGQATALTKLADIELKKGNKETAKSLLLDALKIRDEIQDKVGEAYTRNLLGIIENLLGSNENSLTNFNKALLLNREFFDQNGELVTLYNLANFQKQQGKLSEALNVIKEAIGKIENTRSRFVSRSFQSSYFATNQKYYELCIDVLMSLHKLAPKENYYIKAFEVSEQMRARNLLDLVNSTTNTENFLTLNSDDFKKREEIQRQLSFLATQIIKLKGDQSKIEEVQNIERNFEKLKNKLELIETEIKSKRGLNNNTNPFTPLTIQQIQKDVLDNDSALIQYFLGETNSYVWVITNSNVSVFTLPPRAEIENLADKVYSVLTERNKNVKWESQEEEISRIKNADNDYLKVNSALSRLLLGSIENDLQNKKRLLISADGKLYFLPFGALVFGETQPNSTPNFLLEKYEIVSIPSASTIALIRQKRQEEIKSDRILVLADPVFDSKDERVSLTNNLICHLTHKFAI